jgi:hypothetical protein
VRKVIHRSRLPSSGCRSTLAAGWLLALGSALAACSGHHVADFGLLYRHRASVARRAPVIVLPGVMGSRLVRSEDSREVRFPLGFAGAEVLATFPGLAELFPHPELDWMIEADGMPAGLDLFSLATWRDNRVGIFAPAVARRLRRRFESEAQAEAYLTALAQAFERSLARGRRFQRALAVPLADTDVSFYVFGSGCTATPARCLVERDRGELRLRIRPEEIRHPLPGIDYPALMLEPGDGSVTKSSLLGLPSLVDRRTGPPSFPLRAAVFVCAPHETLTSNPTFLDNLLHILLYRD